MCVLKVSDVSTLDTCSDPPTDVSSACSGSPADVTTSDPCSGVVTDEDDQEVLEVGVCVEDDRKRALDRWVNPDFVVPDADTECAIFVDSGTADVELICPVLDLHLRGMGHVNHFGLHTLRNIPDLTCRVLDVAWCGGSAEVTCMFTGTQLHPQFSFLPVGKFAEFKTVSSVSFSAAGLVCREVVNLHVDSLPTFGIQAIQALSGMASVESVPVLASTPHGSRVIQECIESSPQTSLRLLATFRGSVLQAAMSHHANFVLQKYINDLPSEAVRFFIEELCDHTMHVARHVTACRVLQRLIEHCPHQFMEPLYENLLLGASELFNHKFGNYVMQRLLEHGNAEVRSRLAGMICSNAGSLVRQWASCNVVRCAFMHCSAEDVRKMAHAIAPDASEWRSVVKHRHACYIAKEIRQWRRL